VRRDDSFRVFYLPLNPTTIIGKVILTLTLTLNLTLNLTLTLTLIGKVILSGKSGYYSAEDEAHLPHHHRADTKYQQLLHIEVHAAVCAPIRGERGEVVAALLVANPKSRTDFDQREIQLVESFASYAQNALLNERLKPNSEFYEFSSAEKHRSRLLSQMVIYRILTMEEDPLQRIVPFSTSF